MHAKQGPIQDASVLQYVNHVAGHGWISSYLFCIVGAHCHDPVARLQSALQTGKLTISNSGTNLTVAALYQTLNPQKIANITKFDSD